MASNDQKVRDLMAGGLGDRLPTVAPRQAPAPCLCGCGAFPKGGRSRFVPGHDAKLKSRLSFAARYQGDDEDSLATKAEAEEALAALGWEA